MLLANMFAYILRNFEATNRLLVRRERLNAAVIQRARKKRRKRLRGLVANGMV
jgi:hypothetical protein